MSYSVIRAYVLKDLYFSRVIIAGAFLAAAVALGLFEVGASSAALILIFSAAAAPAALLCLFLIFGERQGRAHLFDLSLPISPAQYMLAKVLAITSAFAVPWVVLGAGVTLLLLLQSGPSGAALLPYATTVWLFVLDEYCLILSVCVASQSAAAMMTAMIVFNLAPALFFAYVAPAAKPALTAGRSAAAVWSPHLLWIVEMELAVAAALFAVVLRCVFRQQDQV
jgi:hypothetical protein